MPKKKVFKKITKRVSPPKVDREENDLKSPQPTQPTQTTQTKKHCIFCKAGIKPTYTDSQALRKFINDRGKILPKLRTGVCSKHQRMVTHQIKYARHLALLPFTSKV